MSDLSTLKPSISQKTWSSMPWGLFLFLLAVFVFATPLYKFTFGQANIPVDFLEQLQGGYMLRQVALITLGAFALFNILRIKSGRFQINGLLGWLILLYLVWASLSIIWAVNPSFTTKRVGILLLFSLGALYVADRFSFKETIALIFFICAVSILIGLVLHVSRHYFFPFNRGWRFGGNVHPIDQGWNCGLLLFSSLALYKKTKQNRAVYLGIAFIAFLLLVLTRSRGPFVSCVMGSAVYWGLTSTKLHRGALFSLGIIMFVCSTYFIAGSDLLFGFGENLVTLGRVGQLDRTADMTGRTPMWNALLLPISQRPFTGYGYDGFFSTTENLSWIENEIGWTALSPHSGYIGTILGLGYTGGILLVLILFLSVKKSLVLAKGNSDYAFTAAVFVWLIMNLISADQLLTRPNFTAFAWMVMLFRLAFIRGED